MGLREPREAPGREPRAVLPRVLPAEAQKRAKLTQAELEELLPIRVALVLELGREVRSQELSQLRDHASGRGLNEPLLLTLAARTGLRATLRR